MLVLQARNSSLILKRLGNKISVFINDLDTVSIKTDRNIQAFNVANGTTIEEVKSIPKLLFFDSKKILILDSSAVFIPDLKPSIVIITQSPKMNFERFFSNCKPEIVIVDASNYRNVVERIRETCLQQKIPFHAVAEKGFYRIKN